MWEVLGLHLFRLGSAPVDSLWRSQGFVALILKRRFTDIVEGYYDGPKTRPTPVVNM